MIRSAQDFRGGYGREERNLYLWDFSAMLGTIITLCLTTHLRLSKY